MTFATHLSDEEQIRALIDDRIEAVKVKDVRYIVDSLAPDIVSFDVVNPLRRVGSGDAKKRTESWFSSFETAIGFEVRDLSITTSGDVAYSHALHRYSGTTADGQEIGMWVRATTGYRKTDGRWTIAHEHQSIPFDPETGKASLDLLP